METSNNGGKEVSMGITLDSIIPPPPSFEGLNNPFRDKTQVTPSSVPQSGNKQTSIITDSDIKVRAQPNPPNGVVTKVGNASKMDKTENGKNCCKKFTVNGHEMECCKWKLYSDNTTSNGYCKRRRHKTVSKELAPSLRNYFKPNNGSGSNRKLKILASRLTNVGKLQYLVEWDTF